MDNKMQNQQEETSQLIQLQDQQVLKSHLKEIGNYIVQTNKVLGSGKFSTVYLGYLRDNEEFQVAVKEIETFKFIQNNNQTIIKSFKREVDMMKKIKNKHIVELYDVILEETKIYIFLEYCQDGDLKRYFDKSTGGVSEQKVIKILIQIVEAFKEIHSKNLIHRDLKLANILIKDGIIKVSDFGFAREILPDKLNKPQELTQLGTPIYMSPQCLAGENFSSKCDVWSLGIILYQLLYNKYPFVGFCELELLKNMCTQPLEFDKKVKVSPDLQNLIKKMLEVSERKRLSWNEIFQHKVIQQYYQLKNYTQNFSTVFESFISNFSNNSKMKQKNDLVCCGTTTNFKILC